MKVMKRTALTVLLSSMMLLGGCSLDGERPDIGGPSSQQPGYPRTVTQMSQYGEMRDVVYQKEPKRVLTVWQNSVETLLALGKGDSIISAIGVPDEKYIREEYREAYRKIPHKSMHVPDVESVMMMETDFILGWYSTFSAKALRSEKFWNQRNVGTYFSTSSYGKGRYRTLDEEFQYIRHMGDIFNEPVKAEVLVKQMEDDLAKAYEEGKKQGRKPRAAIVEFQGHTLYAYGAKTLAGDMLNRLGGELLSPDLPEMSYEQLIDLDPDVIFLVIIESDYDQQDQLLQRMLDHPALQSMKAIQEKRVEIVPLYTVYSPGIRAHDGLEIMLRGLYGTPKKGAS